jgi:energy-coupling factor transporter ATP-binding protein EcfA2
MCGVADHALSYMSGGLQTDTESPAYRKNQLLKAFDSPLDWTESQVKSPALLKLRDSLRVDLGSLLVFTSPYGAGKSHALKDLTVLLRRNSTYVKYIDGRAASSSSSAGEFIYGSLLLTKDAARVDLGPLLPVSTGMNKTTIIIDHFEDLMDKFGVDAMAMAKNWARETYDTRSYRVLVCVAPESRVLEVLNWNGGVKFRYVHI